MNTIHLKCDLRFVIRRGATESIIIQTAVEMGLLQMLDKLAERAAVIEDAEAARVLRTLCLLKEAE